MQVRLHAQIPERRCYRATEERRCVRRRPAKMRGPVVLGFCSLAASWAHNMTVHLKFNVSSQGCSWQGPRNKGTAAACLKYKDIYIYIYALGSGATTPPPPPNGMPPPHPPMAPTPATPPSPCFCADLPLTCPCCRLGNSGIRAAAVSRTRHELQLLHHEGCMAMVMVAAVL